MAVSRNLDIMIDSFLDGITGAALFGKVRLPGAPTVLVDTRSPEVAYPRVDAAKPQHGSESVNAASVGMPTPVRGAQAANPKCGAVTEKSARPKTDLPADLGEWVNGIAGYLPRHCLMISPTLIQPQSRLRNTRRKKPGFPYSGLGTRWLKSKFL